MDLLIVGALAGVVFGGGCAIIASNKKRDPVGWFLLGFFFSFVALIVVAVLTPGDKKSETEQPRPNAGLGDPDEHEVLRKKAAELKASLASSRAKLSD